MFLQECHSFCFSFIFTSFKGRRRENGHILASKYDFYLIWLDFFLFLFFFLHQLEPTIIWAGLSFISHKHTAPFHLVSSLLLVDQRRSQNLIPNVKWKQIWTSLWPFCLAPLLFIRPDMASRHRGGIKYLQNSTLNVLRALPGRRLSNASHRFRHVFYPFFLHLFHPATRLAATN